MSVHASIITLGLLRTQTCMPRDIGINENIA